MSIFQHQISFLHDFSGVYTFPRESGVIYTEGWPNGYEKSSYDCELTIHRSFPAYGIRIVFMDISMYDDGIQSDSVQLFGMSLLMLQFNLQACIRQAHIQSGRQLH